MKVSDRLLRQVGEAEAIPWGYGFAWYDFRTREITVFPIPLNLILRFGRWLYYQAAWAGFPIGWEKSYLGGLEKTYREGYRDGFKGGLAERDKGDS